MIIGVPKETKSQDHRVALLPSAAYLLNARGHRVVVERDAGIGSGYTNAEYVAAGAEMIDSHAELFERAEMIVKVKEPLPSEYGLLRPGQILFTYLHLAANGPLTEALQKSRVTAIAYETIEINRRLPLLEPMSEIAGRMSAIVGCRNWQKPDESQIAFTICASCEARAHWSCGMPGFTISPAVWSAPIGLVQ